MAPPTARARARPVAAAACVLLGCDVPNHQPPMLTAPPPVEVYAGADIVGFWQFSAGDRPYFGVLDRAADRSRSTLTIGRVVDGRPEVVRRIVNDDVSARGIDGAASGTDLVLVVEVNRGRAAHIVRADLAALVSPSAAPVRFQLGQEVALTARQREQVRLPPGRLWNVADFLGPEEWLFSPRLVRGGAAPAPVVANTADGRAITPGADADADARALAIANAAQPQAYQRGTRRYVAYQRYAQPYFPFWTLARYSGGAQPRSGDLVVVEDGAAPQDLSAGLGVGPVVGFTLAGDTAGVPWIFALRGGASGTEAVAIMRQAERWAVVDEWALGAPSERLTAEHDGAAWHLVYSTRAAKGWSLRHERWPKPR